MTSETVNPIVVLTIIFGTAIVILVSTVWFDHRTKAKALDVLRAYAQRGDEPPASIVEAVGAVTSGHKPAAHPPKPPVTAPVDHLAIFAGFLVAALGSAGIAWWRILHDGEPGGFGMLAVFAAVFFFMSSAARLVSVFSAPMPTLENDMSHVAANAVGVLGTLGIAWWQMSKNGEPAQIVFWSLAAAIFLAAMLARSLVRVFTKPIGARSRDDR
jgi:hypothetical protein